MMESSATKWRQDLAPGVSLGADERVARSEATKWRHIFAPRCAAAARLIFGVWPSNPRLTPGAKSCRHFVANAALIALLLPLLLTGCQTQSAQEVVVYAALDKEFSEPVLDRFTEQTQIKVLPK